MLPGAMWESTQFSAVTEAVEGKYGFRRSQVRQGPQLRRIRTCSLNTCDPEVWGCLWLSGPDPGCSGQGVVAWRGEVGKVVGL